MRIGKASRDAVADTVAGMEARVTDSEGTPRAAGLDAANPVLRPPPRSWLFALVASLASIGAAEAVLLELSATYFSGGFMGIYIDTFALTAGFFVAAAIVDLWFVLAVWCLLLPILRRLPLSPSQALFVAVFAPISIPFVYHLLRLNVARVLGTMATFELLWDVSGGSTSVMATQAIDYLSPAAVATTLAGVGLLGGLVAARLLDGRSKRLSRARPPQVRFALVGCAVAALAATLILTTQAPAESRVGFGLASKVSTRLLTEVMQRLTDVDRDGYGLLARPRDQAPFDGSRHPYAFDVPGNGVDENGVGGDHPADFESVWPVPWSDAIELDGAGELPHVLLIYLETFRGDLLDRTLRGREVTPFLNRLAREGASTDKAFVHQPGTRISRAQLFGGRLLPFAGQSTLIDDFKRLGYRVAHLSGQDDSYGDSEPLLGVERADYFYDARQDADRRTSRTASKVSLQISWQLLNQRVAEFLETHDPSEPLFLYVNFVDTHFPYHHDELERILDVEPIGRGEIGPERAQDVWETYLNTAANVDRGIEQLVALWKRHTLGHKRAILVTADHGEAFYEKGYLGHGRLEATQTRVPLIVWGLGGDWPEPLGATDVRGLLQRNLRTGGDAGATQARFVPDPARQVPQHSTRFERTRAFALQGLETTVRYDFRDEHFEARGAADEPIALAEPAQREMFTSLIRQWEGIWLRARREARASGRSYP